MSAKTNVQWTEMEINKHFLPAITVMNATQYKIAVNAFR